VEEPGGDLAFLGIAIWTAGRWRLPLGGMQRMSDALHRAAEEAGVDVLCGCPVRRVLVDKGVAVGIVNEDDSMILATKAIVGAIPIPALLGELVEAHSLSSQEQADLRNFVSQEGGSIATSMFCLNDQPCYKSARYDAQINRCFKTTVGYESPADILNSAAENRTGLLPRPAGTIRVNTLWDESQAPPGMHVAGIDSPFPAVSSMGADMWRQVEESFAQAFYDVWSRHTDNLHAGSSAGMLCDLGARFERRMLLRLGSTQYRTSIEKLYMCGPGTYPGGGVHGANAYNAARVVMSDLGIESRLDKR
jgi:phytoene dehydrogenase-like protein